MSPARGRRRAGADGVPETDGVAPGLTVTVTVGTGLGLGGSTESLGFWAGPAITTPTTPSEVKSTNGRTSAVRVSDPALPWTFVTCPIGTPGTYGRFSTEPKVTTFCPGCSTAFASNSRSVSTYGPDSDFPVPVTAPIWLLPTTARRRPRRRPWPAAPSRCPC